MKSGVIRLAALLFAITLLAACDASRREGIPEKAGAGDGVAVEEKIVKSNTEWRESLSDEEYRILREKGTERAFTGKYWNEKAAGIYVCAGCGHPLFSSDTKYDSGSGWPSFWQPVGPDHVAVEEDQSLGVVREEVLCRRCDGHLGHVFDDGPRPTGLRTCINSASLRLVPDGEAEKEE